MSKQDLLPTPFVGEVVQWLPQGRSPTDPDDIVGAPSAAVVVARVEPGVVSLRILSTGQDVVRVYVPFHEHPMIATAPAHVANSGAWRYIPVRDKYELHGNLLARQDKSREEQERKAASLKRMREEAEEKMRPKAAKVVV